MKIVGMTDGIHQVLILVPENHSLHPKDRALFFSRSVTILGEFFVVGSEAVDAEGHRIPAQPVHLAALNAFFAGTDTLWCSFPIPPLARLLSLSDIPETAPDSDPEYRCP